MDMSLAILVSTMSIHFSIQVSLTTPTLVIDASSLAASIMISSEYLIEDWNELIQVTPYHLEIPSYSLNRDTLDTMILNNATSMRDIVIGDGSLTKVRQLELDGLSELESIVIGGSCFKVGSTLRSDGSFEITNCPKLRSIQIGEYSFEDYLSFEMSNLPLLESIQIKRTCFCWTPFLSLTGKIR